MLLRWFGKCWQPRCQSPLALHVFPGITDRLVATAVCPATLKGSTHDRLFLLALWHETAGPGPVCRPAIEMPDLQAGSGGTDTKRHGGVRAAPADRRHREQPGESRPPCRCH